MSRNTYCVCGACGRRIERVIGCQAAKDSVMFTLSCDCAAKTMWHYLEFRARMTEVEKNFTCKNCECDGRLCMKENFPRKVEK